MVSSVLPGPVGGGLGVIDNEPDIVSASVYGIFNTGIRQETCPKGKMLLASVEEQSTLGAQRKHDSLDW